MAYFKCGSGEEPKTYTVKATTTVSYSQNSDGRYYGTCTTVLTVNGTRVASYDTGVADVKGGQSDTGFGTRTGSKTITVGPN